MRNHISLQGRAWAYVQPSLSYARRSSLIIMYGLAFCVAAAQGQTSAVSAPASGAREQTAPVNSRTRARRVSEAPGESGNPSEKRDRSAAAAAASDTAGPTAAPPQDESGQASSLGAEESAPVADKTQKGDRLSALRAQIAEATDKSERARLQRTLVDYLVALNRKSEAITELRAMALDERIDPVGFYNIGNALARLGDTDAAIEAYRKAIDQRHGNYARALNNLGVVLMRGKRWTEALEVLSKALRQENFRYGEASYNLGRLHAARGEAKLAIKEWTRTLSLQPDHLDAALALARTHAASGDPERGIAVIDAFVERQGPNAALIEVRNEIISGQGRTKTKTPAAHINGEAGASATTPVEPPVRR